MPRAAKRIIDLSVVVVLGARGSGKSSLAAFLSRSEHSLDELGASMTTHGIPWSMYFDAFSQRGTAHPDANILGAFVRGATDEMLRDYWLSWLSIQLTQGTRRWWGDLGVGQTTLGEFDSSVRTAVRDPGSVSLMGDDTRATLVASLDRLEQDLVTRATQLGFQGAMVTADYDDLDMVGAFEPAARSRFIRALLGLWTSFSTRYRHVRAKIFLPAGLFDLRLFDTLDVSKLMARAERIEWDAQSLYRLVLRELGAQGEDIRAWLETLGVRFREDGTNGWIPDEPSDEVTRRWLSATLRSVIVANGARSVVQEWIPNRLRDGRDRVAPRSMLGFFRESARVAQGLAPRAPRGHLLTVDDAVNALDAVGSRRVEEVREVYEWVDRLLALKGRVLPLPRTEVESLLEADPPDAPRTTPPRDGRTVTTELVRMGTLRELGTGEKLDVPELFTRHFGVLRRDPRERGATADRSARRAG